MAHNETADYLDTLATACAAAGQYTNAISYNCSIKVRGLDQPKCF